MTVSDVTSQVIMNWGHIETQEDADIIQDLIMPTAKARLCDYTGLTEAELDEHESITMGYVALCVFLYDNRTMNILNDKQNLVIQSFLDAHRVNFL